MWPFKKKKEQVQELKRKIPTPEEILNGADPWIIKTRQICKKDVFEIYVFRYDTSEWSTLAFCSESLIGIDRKEFERIMVEHFGAINQGYGSIVFETKEDAFKTLEEFRPYYESFHLPKALMGRLSCYCEGGYPPYFLNHLEKMDTSHVKKEKIVKLRRTAR